MHKLDVIKFFKILADTNPVPKGELEFKNHYTFLIAVVLSAQATDKSVNKATAVLYAQADTPQAMLQLDADQIKSAIKAVGLSNTKTKNIIALSHQLIERFNGIVPDNIDDLMSLPGVGRKTANVVLNCLFKQPTIAVDTHVFRVANRTGLAKGTNPTQVEMGLMKIVPDQYLMHAHHWLILHGRYICKAINPQCASCPVNNYCQYFINNKKVSC